MLTRGRYEPKPSPGQTKRCPCGVRFQTTLQSRRLCDGCHAKRKPRPSPIDAAMDRKADAVWERLRGLDAVERPHLVPHSALASVIAMGDA